MSKVFFSTDVTASGNSEIFFFLLKVTFFTSKKALLFLFSNKKSNLVSLEKTTSRFTNENFLILLFENYLKLLQLYDWLYEY